MIGKNLTAPNSFLVLDVIHLPEGRHFPGSGVEVPHLLGENASDGEVEAPEMLHVARSLAFSRSRRGAKL